MRPCRAIRWPSRSCVVQQFEVRGYQCASITLRHIFSILSESCPPSSLPLILHARSIFFLIHPNPLSPASPCRTWCSFLLDVSQLNLSQQNAATPIAGAVAVLPINILMSYYDHHPLKYGKPDANASAPPVPKSQSGPILIFCAPATPHPVLTP